MKLSEPVVIFLLVTPIWSQDHNFFQHSDAITERSLKPINDVHNTVYELAQYEPYHEETNNEIDDLEDRTLPLLPSFDLNKVTAWTDTPNLVSFTVTVLTTQVFIAIGWFVAGKKIFSHALKSPSNYCAHAPVSDLSINSSSLLVVLVINIIMLSPRVEISE